jgi:hypothetical protein
LKLPTIIIMTTTLCNCCKEDVNAGDRGFDPDLGDLCFDCAVGIRNGLQVLRVRGVTGTYHGECPDKRKEEK